MKKWLILAVFAEASVLSCLIFTFDGALHSLQSARLTWDHAAVATLYAYARIEFSRKRMGPPSRFALRRGRLMPSRPVDFTQGRPSNVEGNRITYRQEPLPDERHFPTRSASRQEALPVRV